MNTSVYERRKFVRVDVNLDSRLNNQLRVAIKKLSLGGCLVESPLPLRVADSIQVEFQAFGEHIRLTGSIIHALSEHRFGIRFEAVQGDQIAPLSNIIGRFQDTGGLRRPTRLQIQQEAVLDRDPSLLINLSEGGCFLKTGSAFHQGDIVEIRFALEGKSIDLAGQIRWTTPTGIGVEYLSPEPSHIHSISDFITRQIDKI